MPNACWKTIWLLLTLAICSLVGGCMTKRSRLVKERSALLAERDQIQQPWQPQALQPKKNAPLKEHSGSPDERIQKIDERVAELDVELLQLR